MAKSKVQYVVFESGRAYLIPRLERLLSLAHAGHLDLATLQFECEGGAVIDVPISSQTLDDLGAALADWKARLEKARPKDATRH